MKKTVKKIDTRWENIQASITTPEATPQELELGITNEHLKDMLEFRFDVRYNDRDYYVWQRISRKDLEGMNMSVRLGPEISVYNFLLDEMVESMDKYLGENGTNDAA